MHCPVLQGLRIEPFKHPITMDPHYAGEKAATSAGLADWGSPSEAACLAGQAQAAARATRLRAAGTLCRQPLSAVQQTSMVPTCRRKNLENPGGRNS